MKYIDSEEKVRELIEISKNIIKKYPTDDVLHNDKDVENENVIYHSVMLFDKNGISDLGFAIEWYKISKSLGVCIINSKLFKVGETVNFDTVRDVLNNLNRR